MADYGCNNNNETKCVTLINLCIYPVVSSYRLLMLIVVLILSAKTTCLWMEPWRRQEATAEIPWQTVDHSASLSNLTAMGLHDQRLTYALYLTVK